MIDVTPFVALSQVVIFFSVLCVWLAIVYGYWTRRTHSRTAFSAITWGFTLVFISVWRTFSFVDSPLGLELTPDHNIVAGLTIWIVCAIMCSINVIVWLWGDPPATSPS